LFPAALFLLLLSGCASGSGGGGGGGGSPSIPKNGSIQGRLFLPERIILDSDNRDPQNPETANNTIATAQAVVNLTTIIGNVDAGLDPNDYFEATLNAGETITLTIADSANLDLFLYQGGAAPVASATGTGATEAIAVPAAGVYQLRVRAVTGGSNYLLDIGGWSAALAPAASTASDDFVPGEVLVKLKSASAPAGADPNNFLRFRAEGAAQRHGAAVRNLDPAGLARLALPLRFNAADPVSRAQAKRQTLKTIEEMRSDPEVLFAEPNFIVHAVAVPNDSRYNEQWNLALLNLPAAWDLTVGSADVIVAVVDTGVLYDHPDLAANILRDGGNVVGYDMISNVASANDGNGIDPNPYDSGDEADVNQSSYHGTHVAGIIAAVGNNGLGVAGVGWITKIMPVRVLGKGGGDVFDVAEGIKFAAGLSNSSNVLPQVGGVVTPADVINLSLGGGGYSQTMQDAINRARSAGVIVVAAAGNGSTSTLFYPAACTGVVGVSAVDLAGNLAYYSNYGTYVDLAAPGGDVTADLDHNGHADSILSTLAIGLKAPTSFTYAYYQGTSMATPHVSGVVALMKAYYRLFAPAGNDLSPQNLDDLIHGAIPGIDSITDYPRGYRENQRGYGLIDAYKAVLAAGSLAGSTASSADLDLNPRELNFGFNLTSLETQVLNRGVEPLQGVTVGPYTLPWLSHSLVGPTLTLTVNRTALADGTYSADLTVRSDNGGDQSLHLVAYQGADLVSNAGAVYVLLIDNKGRTADSYVTDLGLGYNYSFTALGKGLYTMVAGTDLDNDGFLGDAGELFGSYPSNSAPQFLSLAAGQMLIDRNFKLESVFGSGPVHTPIRRPDLAP
jgi:serine protease